MAEEIKGKIGKKMAPEEQKKVDLNKISLGTAMAPQRPQGEVEGEWARCGDYAQCPYCFNWNHLVYCTGPNVNIVRCAWCGGVFTV